MGASFDGTVIKPAADLNEAYYKKPANPIDILVRGNVQSEQSEGLRGDLEVFAVLQDSFDAIPHDFVVVNQQYPVRHV